MKSSEKVTALDLTIVDPLPEATKKYFDICQEKLGMIPNVLKAYAFDINKLDAFTTIYNEFCLLYTSPSPRDVEESRMPSSA